MINKSIYSAIIKIYYFLKYNSFNYFIAKIDKFNICHILMSRNLSIVLNMIFTLF